MSGTRLRHVRWLGGATGTGKTTVAAKLAMAFSPRVYSTDAAISAHSAEGGPDAPLLSEFGSMSMDERWLNRDAQTMVETFPWFSGERFDCIVRDLQSVPPEPLTLAEGFRLLPGLVHPLLDERRQAVWLTTTPEFRRRAFMAHAQPEQLWCRTSDPPTSLERVLERDTLFADRLAGEAQERSLKVVVVDGSADRDRGRHEGRSVVPAVGDMTVTSTPARVLRSFMGAFGFLPYPASAACPRRRC